MYTKKDKGRIFNEPKSELAFEAYRIPWRKDYARLIHSPSFRRLQGKTQLYPGTESDFFRNRLTHSLEVAQISKSIAIRINRTFLKGRVNSSNNKKIIISPDIAEFAGLAHDLGHPPFGHIGEEALDKCMEDYGGFEGNGQTLRILAKIEKKFYDPECPVGITPEGEDKRVGLNLTYRSLAAILKYNQVIPITKEGREKYKLAKGQEKIKPVKGFYQSEEALVERIKKEITGEDNYYGNFKTVECQIMDIADDIAYSVYDLEDAFKAGFSNPFDLLFANKKLIEGVASQIKEKDEVDINTDGVFEVLLNIFSEVFNVEFTLGTEITSENFQDYFLGTLVTRYPLSKRITSNGYIRTMLTSKLIGTFIRGVDFEYNEKYPALSKVKLNEDTRRKVEVLKHFTYQSQILSPRIKMTEYRGKDIIKKIFSVLIEDEGYKLMPEDYQELYEVAIRENDKMRIICDFIAGMTNRYAIEFYGRLTSEDPATIFKPY